MEKPLLENVSENEADPNHGPTKLEYRYNANCLDKLTYGWIFSLLWHGRSQPITQEVLQDLSVEEQSQSIYYKWNDYWNEQKANNPKDPLMQSIKDTFKRSYIIGTIFDFLAYQFTIITPLFIYFATQFLEQDPRQTGWAVFYLLMIPLIRFMRSFFDAHAIFYLSLLGTQISNSVSIGMVNKAMKYSVLCNKQFKMGQISSLMQVDCFRLSLLPKNFNAIIFISYCLIFSIVFMGLTVGFAFLAGFGVLFLISIFNVVVSRYTAQYQKELANATDDRMKITNEVFNNIKFIKVNAWQEYFYDKLMSKRTTEVGWLRKKFFAQSISTFSMWIAPKWILAATYGVYVAIGGQLVPQKTFSIMSLYAYIQFYLQFLPNSLSITIESFNALKRIQKFLLAQEINQSCISYDRFDLPTRDYKSNAIEVQNGNFFWDTEKVEEEDQNDDDPSRARLKEVELNLADMNFTIKKGQMVCVIGGIGAGKSSLMYSLLGQMKFRLNTTKPKIKVNGSMSLVTQKPWIVNDTVRNNITFGQRFDTAKYRDVIHYACLQRDFQLFTHGDQTMIGEKGATLSGGQKARISFARSLYSNSDILLLDDLLSAVDVHVGKFMMTQTLMKYTKSKTRILVTHALYYLKYADKVLIIQDGRIVQHGTYQTIKNSSRFKQMHNNMMKDDQKKRKQSVADLQINLSEKASDHSQPQVNQQIQQQIIREASVHTKKSKTVSAIDRTKLQALRSRKSKMSKVQLQKQHTQKRDRQGSRKQQVQVKAVVKKAPAPSADELMMAEEMNTQSVFKLYASYARYNIGYAYTGLILLVQAAWMISNSISNLWLLKWTDYSDGHGGFGGDYTMGFYIGLYILIGFFYGLFAFIRSLLVAHSSPKMSQFIHESMISNLLFSSLNEFFDRVPLGRIFNRLSKDLSSVDLNVSVYFGSTLVFIFFLGSNIIVISLVAPIYVFWPVIAIYLVLCHFLRMFYSKPAKELTKLQGITKSPIVSCFTQILQGVATIRCYKKQNMFMQNNCFKIDQNKKPIMARKALEVWFTFRLMLCSLIINFTALIYVLFFENPGFEQASEGGLLLVCTLGFDQLMYFLFSNLGAFQTELISIERCQSFMDLEPEAGYLQYVRNRDDLKPKARERRLNKSDGWPDKGRLDFIDLKCRYRKNLDLVLRGLNVTFTGGHKIGVVGRTGSGKSTIMMCLLRILEAADGKIMLDGRDISQLSLDDLRSKITIILQDPCLFAGTVRQNLDPLGQYTDQQLSRALEKTALKQTMDARQGLETQITENGQNLSVGQRQLISIARAILKPTRIVLVDEATANIDVSTESIIYKAMNESFKNSTVVTVAHRLNTVINSDRILVLEGGLLKQYDNPQELLKNPNSFFAQLYNQSLKENKM